MGLGRKEFLRLAGLAIIGLSIDPLKAVAVNKNYYVNKKFGIILEKPDTWDFVAIKDYGRLLSEQILPEEIEITKNEIFEELGQPAFIITKYWQDMPELKRKFSPTISAYINHKSELDFEYGSFEELIELSGIGTSTLLKDFTQTEVEGPFTISNCKAYIRKATYSFEHVELNGRSIHTNLKVVIIEHNDFYYYINMHDSDEVNENTQKEFDAFIETIRLV